MNSQLILERLRAGDTKVLNILYKEYRADFIAWLGKKYGCSETLGVDIFQETILVFYKNVRQGKLNKLKSSIKTYLYAVGRNIYNNHKNKRKLPIVSFEDLQSFRQIAADDNTEKEQLLLDKETIILNTVRNLGLPCKPILMLFYYQRYSIKKIRMTLNYKNDAVVKNMKSRCLKNMKEELRQALSVI